MSLRPIAVAVLLAAAAPVTAQPTGPLPPNPLHSPPADPALKAVPTDAFAFVSLKASKLMNNPGFKSFRDWAAAQSPGPFDQVFGLAPADLDRVTLFAPTAESFRGGVLALVTTRKPYNEARVLKALGVGDAGGRERRVVGRLAEIDGPFARVAFLDDRTLLFVGDTNRGGGDEWVALVAQLLARKPDGPLAAALAVAQNHDLTIGIDIRGLAELLDLKGERVDKDLAPYLVLLRAKTATLIADFDATAKGNLVLTFPDAETAKRAAPVLEEGIKTLAELLADPRNQVIGRGDTDRAIGGWVVKVLKGAKVTAVGNAAVAAADIPYQDELTKFVALLPKSVATDRIERKGMNNLKQLGIAMHAYHDAMGHFPGEVFGGQPNAPAWSWRLQVLPYVEQENIYRQLNMQLPWDHPANLKVLESVEMPKVFEMPGRPAPKGHTYFRVISYPKDGKGNERPFFDQGNRGTRLADITDGLSNTVMIVEAGEAVPWYKPDVLAYDGKLPLPQLGDKAADRALVGMGDGSVRSIRPAKLGERTLRALITRAGGETVSLP